MHPRSSVIIELLRHDSKSMILWHIWKLDGMGGYDIVDNEIPSRCQMCIKSMRFGTVMDVISRIGLVRALYMPDKPNLIYD